MQIATNQNIIGLINSGEIALSFAKNVKDQAYNEGQDLYREATSDFTKQENREEIRKNTEFYGIGLDATKSFLENCYNQALLSEITHSMSNDQVDKISNKNFDNINDEAIKSKTNIFENHIEGYYKSPEQIAIDHPEDITKQYQVRFSTDATNAKALQEFFQMQYIKDEYGDIKEALHYNYDAINNEFLFKTTDNFNFYDVRDLINKNTNDILTDKDRNALLNNLTENFKHDHGEWYKVMEYAKACGETDLSGTNLTEFMRQKTQITESMYNRIMGIEEFSPDKDSFGNIIKYHDMFDYSEGAGGLEEWDLDNQILKKLYESDFHFSVNGKEFDLFDELQVMDGNGNKLDFKYLSMEAFNKLEGKGVFDLDINKDKIKIFKEFCKFKDADRQMLKFRNHENFKKMMVRLSGLKQMTNEYREYSQPIKSAKGFKTAYNVSAGAVNAGYKLSHLIMRMKETADYKKAYRLFLNDRSEVNKMALEEATRKLKNKILGQNAGERRLNTILHPIKSGRDYVLGKASNIVKNNSFARTITLKPVRDKAKKWLANQIYNPIGSIFRKPLYFLMRFLKPLIYAGAVILIFLLIAFIACMGGTTSTSVVGVVSVAPIAEQEDFDAIQRKYDTLDTQFLKTIEDQFLNYANNTNLKGERIYYGVNGLNNEAGMTNQNYKNGIHYNYITDEEHRGRTSNIEDLIAMTAVMMSQQISEMPEIALGTIEWLYNMSHKYYFTESPLYACDDGCHQFTYKCTDLYHDYLDSDMKYSPFHARVKSGGDYEIITPPNKCYVCSQRMEDGNSSNTQSCHCAYIASPTKEDYYGCVSHSQCYHGDDGDMGRSHSGCNNYHPVFECDHECNSENCTHDCSGSPIGCAGYYECDGHNHYSCDTHNYKCCMGHTDILANIQIKFYNDLKEDVNRYNFGESDWVYKKLMAEEGNIYAKTKEEEY